MMFSTKKLFLVLALFMNFALQAASDRSVQQDLFFAECVNYLEDVVRDPNKKIPKCALYWNFCQLNCGDFHTYKYGCDFFKACNESSPLIPFIPSFNAGKTSDKMWQDFLDCNSACYQRDSVGSFEKHLSVPEHVQQNPKDRTFAFVHYFSEISSVKLFQQELEQPHVQEFLKQRKVEAAIHAANTIAAATYIVIIAAEIDRLEKERLARARRKKFAGYTAAAGAVLFVSGGVFYYYKPLQTWLKKQCSRLQLFPRRS